MERVYRVAYHVHEVDLEEFNNFCEADYLCLV
jgi:hypothetical protein